MEDAVDMTCLPRGAIERPSHSTNVHPPPTSDTSKLRHSAQNWRKPPTATDGAAKEQCPRHTAYFSHAQATKSRQAAAPHTSSTLDARSRTTAQKSWLGVCVGINSKSVGINSNACCAHVTGNIKLLRSPTAPWEPWIPFHSHASGCHTAARGARSGNTARRRAPTL